MKYFPFLQRKGRNKFFFIIYYFIHTMQCKYDDTFQNEERQIILQLALQTWTNEKISKHPNEN
jgi:hypothetical protein